MVRAGNPYDPFLLLWDIPQRRDRRKSDKSALLLNVDIGYNSIVEKKQSQQTVICLPQLKMFG